MPATWMEWSPWSQCSLSCGAGGFRQRSRDVIPGKHSLCNKANLKPDEGDSEETEICSTQTIPDWPTCPTPAHEGCWGEWTPCTQTCYNKGSQTPLMTRRKKCIEATLSTNVDFNSNIVTCNNLQRLSETKTCDIPVCPGDQKFYM